MGSSQRTEFSIIKKKKKFHGNAKQSTKSDGNDIVKGKHLKFQEKWGEFIKGLQSLIVGISCELFARRKLE